ncbi:MAG TPA: hypothetical protein VNT81_01775 [Vicinamibacterales bacterium]|nr:hypothetical protein [Vicinamibacterales bacterium]
MSNVRVGTWTIAALICGVLMVPVRPALAADQTEYLRKAPKVLEGASDYVDASGVLQFASARALVATAFKEDVDDPGFYCVIHVLVWGDDTSTIAQSRWYLYRGRGSVGSYAGRWTAERFRGTRIYGADRLGVMYVHLNVPAATRPAAIKALSPLITDPTNVALYGKTLEALIPEGADPDPSVMSERAAALKSLGSHYIEAAYANVSYQVDVVKKLPAPIQNLQDALGMLQSTAAKGIALTERVALYAAEAFDILHVPSDITVTGKLVTRGLAEKTTELGKQTYDNEGLYYWDVSLGIPVRSMTQLDFEASGGQVFAKEVEKTQLMAILNLFPRPVDTKKTQVRYTPHPIVGLALSQKPLEKVLVGGAIGLNRVQMYAGYQWSQVEKPPVADGQSAGESERRKYKGEWVLGLNVPVRQVVEFLKAKK